MKIHPFENTGLAVQKKPQNNKDKKIRWVFREIDIFYMKNKNKTEKCKWWHVLFNIKIEK